MNFFIKRLVLIGTAAFAFSCSEKSSPLTPESKQSNESFSQKPTDLVSFNPKVDILFVIDNSGSMYDTQNNLSQNATAFSNAITNASILDYHIGVTSTNMDECHSTYGSYYKGDCGELMGNPKFIDKSTVGAAGKLAQNMLLGINGSGTEEMFTPVIEALTTNLTKPSNVGFYRPDAYLAVIFITDANEQSNVTPDEFLKFLVAKKGDANKVLGYGVIRKLAEEQSCYSAEDLDSKLEDFLASVVNADKKQNNVLSLCSSDYGIKLSQFANDIVKRSSGTIRLLRLPDTKTIKVTYGIQVIPNSATDGWVYEVSTNSLILAAGIKFQDQGPNVGLSVDFEAIENPRK